VSRRPAAVAAVDLATRYQLPDTSYFSNQLPDTQFEELKRIQLPISPFIKPPRCRLVGKYDEGCAIPGTFHSSTLYITKNVRMSKRLAKKSESHENSFYDLQIFYK
jgi:hypothetical protein